MYKIKSGQVNGNNEFKLIEHADRKVREVNS